MKKSRQASKKRVAGYWVYKTPKGKAPVTYYVKGHLRKRPEKQPKAKLPEVKLPAAELPEVKEEITGELVRYTIKMECLVEYQHRYIVSFSLDKDLEDKFAIQYYHTKFVETPTEAIEEFKSILPTLEGYGHILRWMAIDLYRVSGVGLLTDKHWELIRAYKNPEDVK